ncbi:hypothetical protein C1H76_0230 [Elsinoe australis]|uniref:Uncharacterized protein n=1 Tax=Elsinoe australis TaxID=40998 RepID=A0A4U7B7D6_9PEZI|nr:hypothetical protein C1H76_0230 [Elsinoe australis]
MADLQATRIDFEAYVFKTKGLNRRQLWTRSSITDLAGHYLHHLLTERAITTRIDILDIASRIDAIARTINKSLSADSKWDLMLLGVTNRLPEDKIEADQVGVQGQGNQRGGDQSQFQGWGRMKGKEKQNGDEDEDGVLVEGAGLDENGKVGNGDYFDVEQMVEGDGDIVEMEELEEAEREVEAEETDDELD